MALQLNRVQIAGNLGADADSRYTAEGARVANLRVASNEYVGKDDAGTAHYHTEWHRVVAWGKLADFAATLSKGDAVYIEGVLRTRSYDDRDGVKRTVTEIRATRIQPTTRRANSGASEAEADAAPEIAEEEVPF